VVGQSDRPPTALSASNAEKKNCFLIVNCFKVIKISYNIEIWRKFSLYKKIIGGQNVLLGGQNGLLPFMRAISTS
jgi:hypothetical protein